MMGLLMWDKPKKLRTTPEWMENYGFDGGPTGGYMPNMSKEDEARWKAKVTGKRLGFPQVEIRKTAGAQITIIVNLGEGYNYKHYKAVEPRYEGKTPKDIPSYTQEEIDKYARPTKGVNVHIAANGPVRMTFDEVEDMHKAIMEAKSHLEFLAEMEAAKA
jgi:hypothetical protein